MLKWKAVWADVGCRGVPETEEYYLSLERMARSVD